VASEFIAIRADIPPRYTSVEVDGMVRISVVHVIVIDGDMRSRTTNPASAVPAVVVHSVMAPVGIAVQPRTYEEACSEDQKVPADCIPSRRRALYVYHLRVISGNIDQAWVCRNYSGVTRLDDHILAVVGIKIAEVPGFSTHTLNGVHHVVGVVYIGLPQSGCPIRSIRHHIQSGRIVGYGSDTCVPVLLIYEV
jgi:hypothetical protein